MSKKMVIILIVTIIIFSFLIIGIIIINNKLSLNRLNSQSELNNDIIYNTDNMILVSDYNTFYTLEKIVKDIMNNIYNKNYDDLIAATNKDFLKQTGKDVYLDKLNKLNSIINDSNYNITEYSKLLYQVYERTSNEYNCLINIGGTIHYLLIDLDKENMTYEISNIIISEEI